jgi:hypothetical protein
MVTVPAISPNVETTESKDTRFIRSALIINADDWGRDARTTQCILDCALLGTVSSASAMVFMADSERSACLAREHKVDVGLHLNLTTPFSGVVANAALVEHQRKLVHFLTRNRLAQVIYHPGLAPSFAYVVAAQIDEFQRLYGVMPKRIDGHHHMHLCTNVLLANLLPAAIIVRRNFSFQDGEKGRLNRFYRHLVNRRLKKRHHLTDFFFSLPPLSPPRRMQYIIDTARSSSVEVETHPINPEEYRFLTGDGVRLWTKDIAIAPCFRLGDQHHHFAQVSS